MTASSQDNINLAKFVATAIGFEPNTTPYFDEDKSHSIDILKVADPMDKDVSFYCSVGLSDYPNVIKTKNGEMNIPIELLMVGYKSFDKVANILASTCFCLIKNKIPCCPRDIWVNLVKDHYPDSAMKHVLFSSPFLWQDKLGQPLVLENKTTRFLMATLISEAELQYKMQHGISALEVLLEESGADIFDVNRASVL